MFFSFGARRPEETLRTQELIAALGLTVRGLWPSGSTSTWAPGVLAGTSHLYHLRTTAAAKPLVDGDFLGPAVHGRGRVPRGHRAIPVRRLPGRSTRSARAAGGPGSPPCRRPGARSAEARLLHRRCRCSPDDRAPAGLAGYLIRPAREDDLDAIAGFEVEIAKVSFGDEAITDPGLHRRRVAGALGKQGEITLVAVAEDAPGAAGGLGLAVRQDQLPDRGQVRELQVAGGGRGVTGPQRCSVSCCWPRSSPGRRRGRDGPAHRQGARQEPRHAGAVQEVRLRGRAYHHGTGGAARRRRGPGAGNGPAGGGSRKHRPR